MKSKENRLYFVIKGNVGLYEDPTEAYKNAMNSYNNILVINTPRYYKKIVDTLLTYEATRRNDIDFMTLFPHISKKRADYLNKISSEINFSVAYINRIVNEDGSSKYGILIKKDEEYFQFISPTVIRRDKFTDEVPVLKLMELSKRYDYRGIVRLTFPINRLLINKLSTKWNVEFLKPWEYDVPMMSLTETLLGKDSLLLTYDIR